MPLSQRSRSRREAKDQGRPVDEIRSGAARARSTVMRGAVARGLTGDLYSASGLVGGDAAKLAHGSRRPARRTPFRDVLARALAVQEVNAAMGVIVAAPTAGGAGVLPAVLTGLADARDIDDEQLVDALADRRADRRRRRRAGVAVRRGGRMSGGDRRRRRQWPPARRPRCSAARRRRSAHAVALAQQGTLGLVCDPLGGLVELAVRLPQRDRRRDRARRRSRWRSPASTFAIPADEVIDTMGEIGREMDVRYRETAGGGLAATPTGRRLARERLVQIKASAEARGRWWVSNRSWSVAHPRAPAPQRLSASDANVSASHPKPCLIATVVPPIYERSTRMVTKEDIERFLDRLAAEGATFAKSNRALGRSAPAARSTSTSSSTTRRRSSCCA